MTSEQSRYVPLDVEVLKLAVASTGLRKAEIARQAGMAPATLSDWLSGKRERVSRRTLISLARRVHVPLDRLQGADRGFYPGCGPDAIHPLQGDREFLLPDDGRIIDENWVAHPKNEGAPEAFLGWRSGYHLAWAAFCEAFLGAYHRDLWDEVSDAIRFDEVWVDAYGGSKEAVVRRLVLVFQRKMSLTWSRRATLGTGAAFDLRRRLPHVEQVAEMTDFARRGADRLSLRFSAWIDGVSELDYSALHDICRVNLKGLGSPREEARTNRALEATGFFDDESN